MGERTRYTPGTFCLAGLATSDPAAAVAFYTHVFGWEAEPLPAGEAGTYTFCAAPATTSRSVTGRPRRPERRGRRRTGRPTSRSRTPTRPRRARRPGVCDRRPAGAVVPLWQPRPRICATLVNDVCALCWNELATADPGRAKSFFGALLCWQYQAGGSGSVTIIHAGRRNG